MFTDKDKSDEDLIWDSVLNDGLDDEEWNEDGELIRKGNKYVLNMDTTKEYYKKNSDTFIQSTLAIDMSVIYEKFVPLLPKSGKVLDAGCGSGRDSLYFKTHGFYVLAIDSCADFVRFTADYAGVKTDCLAFNEINFTEEFDGIWACASLLHLNHEDLKDALQRIAKALKPGGIFYASFKYGNFSGERNGRVFSDFSGESFAVMISNIPGLKLIESWITDDQRKDRATEKWLNVLLTKNSHLE
jgi:SAM-dependent methyltransferase